MTEQRRELWRVSLHGVLLAQVLLLGAVGGALLWYQGAWSRTARWQEAWRHAHTPWIAMERWIHFRFIHMDAQYWVVPVRLDEGALELRGTPPDAVYWSLTWYEGTHVHESVSSETIALEPDGSYVIHLDSEPHTDNWLPVPPDADKAVLYLRVYEPEDNWPIPMPSVSRGDELLVPGGRP